MSSPHETANLFHPGARFQDRYEILNEVGAGGFGRVYRARQLSTGQDVAVKMLRAREGEGPAEIENQRQRFRREMQLCAALSHPHIVRIIDSGEFGPGLLFAVFEYVPGSTLRQVLEAEGRLESAEALHLLTQVLDALACAHAQGVVHRDLKPENIMVTRTGLRRNATVLDFGLGGFSSGALTADKGRLTGSRDLMGTPAYAAPEQLRGEPPSPRSDLFSWGLILLECLTGETAVSARTAYEAVMEQLGPEPIAIPPWLREQRLGRLLAAVTAKEPAARDMSEQALLEALESIQRGAGSISSGEERRLPVEEGERRQITVVACVTSVMRTDTTPIDLEELDYAIQAQQALYDQLGQASGHTIVHGSMGEVHVIFGYPRASEHDARRAARAALRIIELSREADVALRAERGLVVNVAVGIHSGLGIVRMRPRRSDGEVTLEVVGAPAAVASLLAGRAGTNEILATAETYALLRAEMECEPAGEVIVAGHGPALALFRVLSERPSVTLDSAARAEETPLVGRAGELGHLVELWNRARAGALGIVLLQGEAGIGKSRLVRELRRRVEQGACMVCRCSPEARGTPLQPVIAWLRNLPTPLRDLLGQYGFDVATTWPLFADLLEVPRGEECEPLRLSPERQKELTLRAVASLILQMARRRALVFILEDLHWVDPTTSELIAVLLEEARSAYLKADVSRQGLLLLCSARPEYNAPWLGQDTYVLPLGRLGHSEIAVMINAGRPREKEVSPDVLDRIVERTDGVPLFVEELARALDIGDERAIPSTLREVLAARLDGLSTSAHETAQFAAAFGREVAYPMLRAAVPKDEWVLRQDLMELVDARLVLARRSHGEEGFVFKHALVRDAAYESMVRATRQRVHQVIANALRERLPAIGEQQPELLANHLEEAGDLAAAASYWYRAGDRAFRRAAYIEATTHLERALAVLGRLPETPERIRLEIEALTALGTVHLYTSGHSRSRGREVLSRARTLSEAHGVELSLNIIARLSGTYVIQGDREAMAGILPRCERLLDGNDPVAQLTGIIVLALDAFWHGRHRRATRLLERGLSLYRGDAYRRFAESQGWDAGIYVPLYAVWNLALVGDAEEQAAPALAAALSSFDPQAGALVNVFAMAAAHLRRDTAAARAHAEQAIAVSREQRLFGLFAFGLCGHGFALVREGAHSEGLAEILQGTELLRVGGAMTPFAYYLTYLAEAHLTMGALSEGLAVTSEGIGRCERELARVHEPELFRLEGDLLRLAGRGDEAEARLRRALELAQEHEARTWELRAALSLGRLLCDDGRVSEARALLQAVHDAFPSDGTAPDLLDARNLLAACA